MGALSYIILLTLTVAILGFLLIPVSLRFDSTEKSLTVRWMSLSVTKTLGREKPRRPKEKKWTLKAFGRGLLKDRYLFAELLQKGYRTVIDLVRSVSIREMEATFSTPDPLWNGVLWGVFANIHLENVSLSMNFQNINSVRGWLQFHPYRIIKVAVGLLIRLPYLRIIRTASSIKRR